jgi:hypothetical protein
MSKLVFRAPPSNEPAWFHFVDKHDPPHRRFATGPAQPVPTVRMTSVHADATGPIMTTSTSEPAAIPFNPASTIARPFASTIDVDTPEP